MPYDRVELDLDSSPLSIHLIGIGGAGMSATALVLHRLGHRVSGSDGAAGAMVDTLRDAGIEVWVGHDAGHVVDVDVVGVSTAIAPTNPEILEARRRGIPVVHRFDLLAAIGATRNTLSVSGTHGKTTTSALVAMALDRAGMDPSFIIGAAVAGFGAGWRWTDGSWLVLEADESDSTFLAPRRAGAIVTNVEADHLDHHGSLEALREAFAAFVTGTDGPAVLCLDDVGAAALVDAVREDATGRASIVTYGVDERSDLRILDERSSAAGSSWTVQAADGSSWELSIGLPGHHLVLNATAAFGLARAIGADPDGAIEGIAAFAGTSRRFEHRGQTAGVTFIDDYAHTPTEVRAVMSAVADGDWPRVVAVFQPHRYSRTAAVWTEYAEVFEGADVVVITEVYAAGEEPIPGVGGEPIAQLVADTCPNLDVRWMSTRPELVAGLTALLAPGDLCLTMGAGDLTTLATDVQAALPDGGDPRG